jgi:hypothetical protein
VVVGAEGSAVEGNFVAAPEDCGGCAVDRKSVADLVCRWSFRFRTTFRLGEFYAPPVERDGVLCFGVPGLCDR